MKIFIKHWPKAISIFLFIALFTAYINTFAVFYPGETLDPSCAPGAVGCIVDSLPSQTGNSGRYLTTDGTNVSWNSTPVGVTASSSDVFTNKDLTSLTNTFPTFNQNTTGSASSLSGAYIDWNAGSGGASILNKPTIPTTLASLTDDSTHRLVTDAEKTSWNAKQEALVSGTNIKTINSTSLLGSGDIAIAGMVYPGAGIANSTGSAWGTSYTTSGSGTVLALATSPVFVTPTLGDANATNINLPNTSSSSTGVIYKGGTRFMHNFALAGTDGANTFLGPNAGNFTMTGSTTYFGSYNTGVGNDVLKNNTTGYDNTAMGHSALVGNLTGIDNTGVGVYALFANQGGNYNTGVGVAALRSNTSGVQNTAVGINSLFNVTTTSYNVGIGRNAGRFLADGVTTNQTPSNAVYIGSDTKALSAGQSNEIVIGYNAIGNGSNTATIGSSSLLRTYLTGVNLKAGSATAGTAPLKFTSGTNLTTAEAGAMEWDGTNLFITQTTGPTRKTVAYTSDITSQVYPGAGIANSTGSAWGTSYTTTGSGTVLALATTPTFTTNITTPLVLGGSSTTQDLTFQTTSGVGATGADMHFLVGNNGGTEAMTILNDGKVGIGTLAPTHSLTFNSTSTGFAQYNTSDQVTNYERFRGYWSGNVYNMKTESGGTGVVRDFTFGNSNSGTTYSSAGSIRINNSAANVTGGGTNTAISGSFSGTNHANALSVFPTVSQTNGSGASYYALWISPFENTSGTGVHHLINAGTNTAANGGGTHTTRFSVNSVGDGYFAGSVSIGTSSSSYRLNVGNNTVSGIVARFENSTGTCDISPTTSTLSCSSDINLKKNIRTLDDVEFALQTIPGIQGKSVLEKVNLLTPVKYNWNKEVDGDPTHIGFIAQEMEQIFPDLVTTDSKTGLKSIGYSSITPYLVKAVQEMNLKIKDISSLDTSSSTSLGSLIKQFLGDVNNQVSDLYASVIHSDRIETKNLCVGSTCVTEQQFLEMVNNSPVSTPSTPVSIIVPEVTEVISDPSVVPNDTNTVINDNLSDQDNFSDSSPDTAPSEDTTTEPVTPTETSTESNSTPSEVTPESI